VCLTASAFFYWLAWDRGTACPVVGAGRAAASKMRAHPQIVSQNDADLQVVVTAWPELSAAIRAAVLAIVRSANAFRLIFGAIGCRLFPQRVPLSPFLRVLPMLHIAKIAMRKWMMRVIESLAGYSLWETWFDHIIPALTWVRNWDKCERLRKGLIERFVKNSREAIALLDCAPNDPLTLQEILRSCKDVRGGRQLLKDLLDTCHESQNRVPNEV
jgi:hypothetical protein